jgi:hypothetical protein
MTAPAPRGPSIINNHIAKRAPSRHDNAKRLVSHRPQAIDLWLSATAASAAIALITLCAQLP